MPTADHPHTIRFGDMIRCTVCHRQWQATDYEIPMCDPVMEQTELPRDRFRQVNQKTQGYMGPGDHGKTKIKTRVSFRR
jgi:hypothetical protein